MANSACAIKGGTFLCPRVGERRIVALSISAALLDVSLKDDVIKREYAEAGNQVFIVPDRVPG